VAAVLRASGRHFDVDAFVAGCDWPIEKVFRRGEPVLKSRPDGRTHDEAGINVVVSEAGFDDLAAQVRDAVAFLTASGAEVRRLVETPGVTGVTLDFGVARHDLAVQTARLPAELVRLAGACGIALEVSHYLVGDGSPAAPPGCCSSFKVSRLRPD
jgi:hypothetical protein